MTIAPEPIARMHADLRRAASTLSEAQARFLVDLYYAVQDYRIQAGGQIRAASADGEPHSIVRWAFDQFEATERAIKGALGEYAASKRPGRWMMDQYGIGPVIAAGFLAHIDISRAPTVGHIWRFAGLDPTSVWIGRERAEKWVRENRKGSSVQDLIARAATEFGRSPRSLEGLTTSAQLIKALSRRPWNAKLKLLAWKTGQSFMKFHNRDECYYGHVYAQRKALEVQRNNDGNNADAAARTLTEKKIRDEKLRERLESGKLPDGQLELRATRYATKLFLSHLHWVWYESEHGTPPPKPYVVEHLGHAHLLTPPGWPRE